MSTATNPLDLDSIKADFVANGNAMAARLNASAVEDYNRAAANWAGNYAQTGAPGHRPVVPNAVIATFDFTGSWFMQIRETATPLPVMDIDSLAPAFATDVNAIGGPVGGPITDQPGRYYQASGDSSPIGSVYRDKNGRSYVKQADSPFNRFWLAI
jgi:hypothetical protein